MAAEAVRRASKSNYLTSIKNIDSNTIMAIFEKKRKKVEHFIENNGRFCNNIYTLIPNTKRTKTVFSTLNYFGDKKTHIHCHDFIADTFKEIIK